MITERYSLWAHARSGQYHYRRDGDRGGAALCGARVPADRAWLVPPPTLDAARVCAECEAALGRTVAGAAHVAVTWGPGTT